jgi:hypothetical protein
MRYPFRTMTRRGLLLLILLATTGCQQSARNIAHTDDVPTDANSVSSIAEFDDVIHHDGVILFRSWNGHFIGTDCDTDLRFMPNLHVEMVEYGRKIATYKGTYQIDDKGQITVSFAGFDHPWPAMLIRRAATSLELVPASSGNEFVMGNRGNTTLPSNAGTYWPFRHIAANGKLKSGD